MTNILSDQVSRPTVASISGGLSCRIAHPHRFSSPRLKVRSPFLPIAMADSKVKDMGMAEFGRKELNLAEVEMPGLMATRAEFGPSKPLKVAAQS